MDTKFHWSSYLITGAFFVFGFFLFYKDSQELISSLVAALLSACLVFVALIAIHWLIQVFNK